MEYYLHIKTTFNCLVTIENINMELERNKIFTFLVNSTNNLPLLIYPTQNVANNLPYVCYLTNENNTLNTTTQNAEITKYPNNNYLLELKPFNIQLEKLSNQKNKTLNFGGTTHTLTWLKNNSCQVYIDNKQNNNYLEIKEKKIVLDLCTKINNNYLTCIFTLNNEQYLLAIIKYENELYTIINLETVDLIEEEQNKITTYQKQNDFAEHGIVTTYIYEHEIKISKSLVYQNNQPIISKHKEIIPFAFFEAVKIKNYKLARAYLTKELSNKLKNSHLKNFFGNFIKISQSLSPNYTPCEIALVYKGEPNFAKIFIVELNENNKISNIYEN